MYYNFVDVDVFVDVEVNFNQSVYYIDNDKSVPLTVNLTKALQSTNITVVIKESYSDDDNNNGTGSDGK